MNLYQNHNLLDRILSECTDIKVYLREGQSRRLSRPFFCHNFGGQIENEIREGKLQ